uniref:Uncharacterized protein n=1 Tax=viral metagenome TaxID=1070528 RepID=A0A6C0LD93_9ZZZZ
MSSAFYSQGMNSYNNNLPTGGWKTWKGTGRYSNPVATTGGNIRPLTNNDPTNIATPNPINPSCFSRASLPTHSKFNPRPLKQYRKGSTTAVPIIALNPENSNEYITIVPQDITNRAVKSTTTPNLVNQMMWVPGSFSVKHNPPNELNEATQAQLDCKTCDGVALVASVYPEPYLTNNPQPVSTNGRGCCNNERKALRMVRPANTNLPKNYYTTLQQYRQNRCQTYEQRIFNFNRGPQAFSNAVELANGTITAKEFAQEKPGGPLGTTNLYVANCYPNTDVGTNSQIYIVAQAFQILNNAGIFDNTDLENYKQLQATTIQQFAVFLQTLHSGQTVRAVELFANFLSNPYIGMSLSGPSNPRGCKLVVYKPSNTQFATEGGVMASARTLKLAVTTVEKNVANQNLYKRKGATFASLNPGQQPFTPLIYKNKVQKCMAQDYVVRFNGNPRSCSEFRATLSDLNNNTSNNLSAGTVGPTVSNNGISASFSGQPLGITR